MTVPRKVKQHLDQNNIPYLVLNRAPSGHDFIAFNNEDGMNKVTKDAIGKRKKPKPVFLEMNPKLEVTIERRKGYLDACEDHGVKKPAVETLNSIDEINSTSSFE